MSVPDLQNPINQALLLPVTTEAHEISLNKQVFWTKVAFATSLLFFTTFGITATVFLSIQHYPIISSLSLLFTLAGFDGIWGYFRISLTALADFQKIRALYKETQAPDSARMSEQELTATKVAIAFKKFYQLKRELPQYNQADQAYESAKNTITLKNLYIEKAVQAECVLKEAYYALLAKNVRDRRTFAQCCTINCHSYEQLVTNFQLTGVYRILHVQPPQEIPSPEFFVQTKNRVETTLMGVLESGPEHFTELFTQEAQNLPV